MKPPILVSQFFHDGRLGEVVVLSFTADAALDGIGFLHEEEDGAGLPGVGAYARDGIDAKVPGNLEIALPDVIIGLETATLDEIIKEDLVDGAEAAAEQPAFVVTTAGAGRGEARTQAAPGDMVGDPPEDGTEDGMGGNRGATTGPFDGLGREKRGEESPLGAGKPAVVVEGIDVPGLRGGYAEGNDGLEAGFLPGVEPPNVLKFGRDRNGILATFLRNDRETNIRAGVVLVTIAGDAMKIIELPDGEESGEEGGLFELVQLRVGEIWGGVQAVKEH
jgi:hypothetical protein